MGGHPKQYMQGSSAERQPTDDRSDARLRMRLVKSTDETAAASADDVAAPVELESASETVKPNPRHLRRLLIMSDATSIVFGIVLATVIQGVVRTVPGDILREQALLAAILVPIWLLMMGANQLFLARAITRFGEELRRLIVAGLMSIGFLLAVSFLAQYGALSRLWVGLLYVCVTASLVVSRLIARRVFAKMRASGRIRRPVIIVGTGCEAISLLHATRDRPELGYEVLGFTGDEIGDGTAPGLLGSLDDTLDVVHSTGATGAILSVASLDPGVVNRLTRTLTDAGCHVALSSSLHDIDISRTRSQAFDGRLMIYVEPTNRSRTHLFLKRTFDLIVAGLVLLLSLPILAIVAIAIKLDTPGPVLFKQVRVGKDGVNFHMYKLRSMVQDAEAKRADLEDLNECSGALFKIKSDPRITRVGRVIRKTSIDELPQLWNVMLGDMSVVGPRPALPRETEHWTPDLHERLRVLPGITGMWQVSGRSESDFELYRRLDLYYVDNWSLTHDLKILLKTVLVVFGGRGAH